MVRLSGIAVSPWQQRTPGPRQRGRQILEGPQGAQAGAPNVRTQHIEHQQGQEARDRDAGSEPRTTVPEDKQAGEARQRVQPEQEGIPETGAAQCQSHDPAPEQREAGGPASQTPPQPARPVHAGPHGAYPPAEVPVPPQGDRAHGQPQPRQGRKRPCGDHCGDGHKGTQGGDRGRRERTGHERRKRHDRQSQARPADPPPRAARPGRCHPAGESLESGTQAQPR